MKWWVVKATLLVACAGTEPPAPKAPEPARTVRPKPTALPETDAEIGALSSAEVTRTFERLLPALEKCQDARRKEIEVLAGDVNIEVKVNKEGKAVEVKLGSTLGDRATERCIADAVRAAVWPTPQGGRHGIAKTSFALPQKGERDPVAWEPSKVASEVARAKAALSKCTDGKPADVTVYVDTSGKPLSAGASAPSDAAADCLARETMKLRFSSPGAFAAKVTFQVD